METLLLVMFPWRANEWEAKQMFCFLAAQTKKQTEKHLLWTQNVSEKIQKQFLRPQQMLHARANRKTFASATMFPQQCFLVCGGPLKELRHGLSILKSLA